MKKKIKRSTEKDYNEFRKNFVFSCIDVIIIKNHSVLLTKRTQNPHKGSWHLPGNIIRKNLNSFRHDVSHGFIVSPISGKIKTDFQSEELKFFKKIPKNTVPHHKKMIKDVFNKFKKT